MPAYAQRQRATPPRERVYALAGVVAVQLALAFALLNGLRVDLVRSGEIVSRLIEVTLSPPPVPPTPPAPAKAQSDRHTASAPKAEPKRPGGSPGPQPAHAPPSVTPVVTVRPSVAPSGGGTGTGPALGSGSGGGVGGEGYGGDGGGTDLEQIAGEITPRDVPRHLREAGIGGTVGFVFTVGVNGRVTRCAVTRSSGVPELDALTCRLVQQRFVYRPATDRYGRPVSDEVEGEQEWIPSRRY
jgi:protein TonB